MGFYSFVFHECDGSASEVGGVRSLPDIAAARSEAMACARSIMSREVASGRLCLSCWIVVKNDTGHTLFTLQFGEALKLVTDPCAHGAAQAH